MLTRLYTAINVQISYRIQRQLPENRYFVLKNFITLCSIMIKTAH